MNETSNTPDRPPMPPGILGKILDNGFDIDLAAKTAADHILDTIKAQDQDPKTGLLRQEAWMKNLAQQLGELQPGDSAKVMIGDLDGFKAVNDTLEHTMGDVLLGLVGQALQETYHRKSDTIARGSRELNQAAGTAGATNIARLGGDEFAVFSIKKSGDVFEKNRRSDSQETDSENQRVNEKFAEKLKKTDFEPFNVKLSIGVAQYEPGDTAESLFARADHDMFRVKYQGKIDKIDDDDRERLRDIIPFLERKGVRIEAWLKAAVYPEQAA